MPNAILLIAEAINQYYIDLKRYADDNNGYFPLENDMNGLNELVRLGYLPNLFECWEYNFSSRKFIKVQPKDIYRYYGGHTIHKTPPAVIMDSNHYEYTIRLYSDGHIETTSSSRPVWSKNSLIRGKIKWCQ